MKRLFLSALAGVAMVPGPVAATDATYINFGSTNNPVVDAISVINYGIFQASGFLPYETFSTLNYTNFGTMAGSPGWRFEHTPAQLGGRSMAANFVVENPGVVYAQDALFSALTAPCIVAPVDPSYLIVSATNIITRGAVNSFFPGETLVVGANGSMELRGHHVDVARSGLEVLPTSTAFFGDILIGPPPTNFIPDIALYDTSWGFGGFTQRVPLNSRSLWNGLTAFAPFVPSPPTQPGPGGVGGLFLGSPVADSYTNSTAFITINATNAAGQPYTVNLASNVTKGAVFVTVPQSFVAQVGFDSIFAGPATIQVLISRQFTNVVTGLPETAYLSITDDLASTTNRGLSLNIGGCPGFGTARPINYSVNRLPFAPFTSGNNGYPQPDFFLGSGAQYYDTNILVDVVTNAVVESGDFIGYSCFADSLVSRPPPVLGATVTNNPGRVRIYADNLDMTGTRIRGEGQVIIEAKHLVSSVGAVVDCPNLSFNLASTNGLLKVQNLAPNLVERLQGSVQMWSAFWSNTATVVIDNWDGSTNAPITNTITVAFHTLMVNANALSTFEAVTVNELETHSSHTTISDNLTVGQRLWIDGDSLDITGSLTIPGTVAFDPITGFPIPGYVPLQNWVAANAPLLRHLTNSGTVDIVNQAHFGDDRGIPYLSFVNRGTVAASSLHVRSHNFDGGGTFNVSGPMFLNNDQATLQGGSFSIGGEAQLAGRSYRINNSLVSVIGTLDLAVHGSLSDSGAGSANTISVRNGVRMQSKPATGDLLGTTLETVAGSVPAVQVNHTWAGEDRGATAAGYADNVALGTLRLSVFSLNPKFVFTGAGSRNGLYVDLLDLSALTDITNQLQIAPNLTIYYAAASLSFTPPPWPTGQARSAEEFLDGLFGGRLRWVQTFAGPNSSQNVVINGQSVPVNRALATSRAIDSDGDTIPNLFDTEPFAEVPADPDTTPPYSAIAASYNGLFRDPAEVAVDSAGDITVTTTAAGSYSGKLRLGSKRYSFKGQFNSQGLGTNQVSRSGTSPLILVLQVDTTDNNQITGAVTDGNWTAVVQTYRAAYSSANPAPFAGRYTILFPGDPDSATTTSPHGAGYGAITVSASGKVSLSGVLADGQKLSHKTTLAGDGQWSLFAPLYKGGGLAFGLLAYEVGVAEDIHGLVHWAKPAVAGDTYYPAGFAVDLEATGSAFNSAQTLSSVITDGRLALTGGNLGNPLLRDVHVGSNNRITVDGGGKLSITRSTGVFKGNLKDPVTGETVKFQGAILQKQGGGVGFFLGTSASGRAVVTP